MVLTSFVNRDWRRLWVLSIGRGISHIGFRHSTNWWYVGVVMRVPDLRVLNWPFLFRKVHGSGWGGRVVYT